LQPIHIRKIFWHSNCHISIGRKAELPEARLENRRRWSGKLCGSQQVLMDRECHSTQMNVKLGQLWSFVVSIVSVLFSAVFVCAAQQTRPAQAPQPTDIQMFQKVEGRWSEAINRRDQYELELVLSPEYMDISVTGDMTTRDQQIALLFEKGTEPLSLNQHVLDARTFSDLAVVIGSYDEQLHLHGKAVHRKGMFTHIYQNVRGNWLCVHAHRTAAEDPEPERVPTLKKQNDGKHIISGTGQHCERSEDQGQEVLVDRWQGRLPSLKQPCLRG
jgi:ketosteroid isomerase-like protein